jgi:hypothetical protein
MTPPATNGERPYRIEISGIVRESILRLQRRASDAGKGEEFRAAMRFALDRIIHSPLTAGEPQYRLSALKMQVRVVVRRPLVIHYGVCEDRAVVYIKVVQLLH